LPELRIGDVELHLMNAAWWRTDGGQVFGVVPKVVWSRYKEADADNLVECACNGLIVLLGGKVVVCETGFGTKIDAKRAAQVHLREPTGHLLALKRLGISPTEVDVVVSTHLHWDHAGGFTRKEGDHLEVTFPKAKHFVQRTEFDFALNCDARSRPAYFAEDILPVAEAGLVEFIEGDAEVMPGLEFRLTGGHTPGNQIVIFRSGDVACAVTGDLIGMTPHLRRAWNTGSDLDVLASLREKARLVEEAQKHRWLLVLGHEPDQPAGYVGPDGSWLPEPRLAP
jgi:glyoxylase-like metal-dependent hydrolase (beta-lactamase superfamily II)